MTKKLLQPEEGFIAFDLLINGRKIKDSIAIQEISIVMEVNRITSATITIHNQGISSNEHLENSESSDFVPGNEIEISIGYNTKSDKVFKGIVISQRLSVNENGSQLIVVCSDKAINMTKGRFNSIFQNKKDSEALKSITSKYNLKLDIDSTPEEHPVLMQYNCTDWDYLVIRAEANNMLVHSYQNILSIKKMDFSKDPSIEINTQNVNEVDLNLESTNLAGAYKMTTWDSKTQETVTNSVKIKDSLSQGNLTATKLSETIKNAKEDYVPVGIQENEMKVWGESQANRAALNKIKGKIIIQGTAKIRAGDLIKLSGFGTRFNGTAFISKVEHIVHDGVWITELSIGISSKLHASLPDIEGIGASGLTPAIRGTQIAVVKKTYEDPENNYRVLVTLPTLKGTGQEDGIWARMVFPYASSDAGYFFFPEVGDEVLLTFMNNDPRFPVIMGSFYSAKNKPKETPNEMNQFKSIHSKSGINIKFDDVDKILTIETPNKQTIVLNDQEKSIRFEDIHENSIIMNSSGISMKTSKDINLSAKGGINLNATSNLVMKSKSDTTIEALNITQNAHTSFTAKGNSTAELSASGQTAVKGAMVMIN